MSTFPKLPCDYCLISKKATLHYLFNLPSNHPTEREAYGLVTPNDTVLFHSPFVNPQPQPGITAIAMSPTHSLSWLLHTYFQNATAIGIEAEDLTVAERDRLANLLDRPIETISCDDVFKKARQIKTEQEILAIKKAVSITKKTLLWVDKFVSNPQHIGVTEISLAQQVNQYMYTLGATGIAFPSIVAFDRHTAFPHHVPTRSKLKKDSIVLVDIGAQYHGYCGDMTRTWHLGSPSSLFKKVERTVKQAYQSANRLARLASQSKRVVQPANLPSAANVDQAARSVIDAAGFGANFIHTTGHGIGLEAHEAPSISASNQQVLQKGMVITIEPGIYLPGHFGYRYENTLILE